MGGDGEYSASWCLLPSDVSADEMGGRLGEYLGDPVPMEPYAGSAFDGPWVGPTLIAIGLLMCAGVVVVLVVSGRSRSR